MSRKLNISGTLRQFAGTLRKVRIERRTPCEPRANGFVLAADEEWFLLWQFHDFFPDGFSLMRVDGVSHVRFDDYERHWTKMLADEGIATSLHDPQIELAGIHSMLCQLQAKRCNFVIKFCKVRLAGRGGCCSEVTCRRPARRTNHPAARGDTRRWGRGNAACSSINVHRAQLDALRDWRRRFAENHQVSRASPNSTTRPGTAFLRIPADSPATSATYARRRSLHTPRQILAV